MRFLVRYLDAGGLAVGEQTVEAADEPAVRALLASQGRHALSVRRATPGHPARPWARWLGAARARGPGGQRRAAAEVALFCRELQALTGAGLSVVEALEALAAQRGQAVSTQADAGGGEPAAASVHAQLLLRLRAGRSLSAALGDVGGFPALLVASVRSSERTSNLAQALSAYLRYDDLVGALRRRVISAALYPAIVVALGLVIAVFLLWVVIPRFASLYGQMGQGASGATSVLLGASRVLHQSPWVVPVALVLTVAAATALASNGRWRAVVRRLVDGVPYLRRAWREFELARLFEALALLTRGGFSFHEALHLGLGLADTPQARARVALAQAEVERGVSVSRACAAAGLTDEVTVRLLRAAERGGDFPAVLQAVAGRHATAFEIFVERATRVVEPVLLLGVALLVGGMVVLLYMPIFDIASSIR